jgi:hypothetical protein
MVEPQKYSISTTLEEAGLATREIYRAGSAIAIHRSTRHANWYVSSVPYGSYTTCRIGPVTLANRRRFATSSPGDR